MSKRSMWVNLIHDWTALDRTTFAEARHVPICPVAKLLCRSGECMCGTMQSHAERSEAKLFYPKWGQWLAEILWTYRHNKHSYMKQDRVREVEEQVRTLSPRNRMALSERKNGLMVLVMT